MIIGVPTETSAGEKRVAMTPASALQIQKLGHTCIIQENAGARSEFSDSDYELVGVTVVKTEDELWQQADIIAKVLPPSELELTKLNKNKTLISFVYPAQNENILEQGKKQETNIIAMDMIPRISRAQKMDALSSMANISGYRAVIEAGNNFGRFFTGQITAAGKVPPAKVLVIGAGVAGLAAIGTANSLGAIVRAFDVRPEVSEQIESMGAEFLLLDFDETIDSEKTGGYAAPSSPEFREKQLECFRAQAPEIDIVITTALIPNREAPKLWLTDMVEMMKSGSVVVDLAAERGGNCDLTVKDEKVVSKNGVTIIGYTDFPSRMATQSSELYSSNIRHLITDLTPEKDGIIVHDMEDDVIRGATITHQGEITFPPPPPKITAIAAQTTNKTPQKTAEEITAEETAKTKKAGQRQIGLLAVGGLMMFALGNYAPESFMQHFIVFALSCFVGFQVIWNVNHALHTPLMAITNAISGIIIVGALLQINSGNAVVTVLASVSVLIATINIVGGFMVTRRMLQMFQKS
ncbi:UNVERIFIED_CONTAM: hypothetical protein GTU68_016973 [Idotea baltica]|nr:hypothetical protein [Idotea baltica]